MSKKVEQVKKKLRKIHEKIYLYEELKKKAQAELEEQYDLLKQYETEENLKKYKKYIKLGYFFRYGYSDSMYFITELMPNTFKCVDLDYDCNKQYTVPYERIVNAIAHYVECKKAEVSIGATGPILFGVILYDANKKEINLS